MATGSPILMPIGEKIKGRLFNVVGDAIDGIGSLSKEGGYPIKVVFFFEVDFFRICIRLC